MPGALVVRPAPLQVSPERDFDAAALLASFLGRRSPNTLKAYERDVAALTAYMRSAAPELGIEPPETSAAALKLVFARPTAAWANELVERWAGAMHAEGLAPATQARRMATMRSLAKLSRKLGYTTWALEVEGPRVQPYRDTQGPTPEMVQKMLAACGTSPRGKRDRLIVLLLCGFGLRRFEAAGLRLRDYEGHRLRVLGKGNKLVWLTLDDLSRSILDDWIRQQCITDPDAALLQGFRQGAKGEPLTVGGLYRVVQQIGRRAGIRVWPHAFRHSGITQGAEVAQGDIRKLQAFSRHEDPKTVMLYIDRQQDFGGEVREGVVKKVFGGESEDKDG